MEILVFNCGSSSLKFELLDLGSSGARKRTLARGAIEEIGGRAEWRFVIDHRENSGKREIRDLESGAKIAVDWLRESVADVPARLGAVAHRVVHGGPRIVHPVLLDVGVMKMLEEASQWAPLHNPPTLAVISAIAAEFGSVPAVVVPDTAFHATLPEYAREYAIPKGVAQRSGIRRFGFHGLGHAWMSERYAELVNASAEAVNLITLHLGAGCSATVIRAGKSVDTSMGMTPLEGLMMATRSGDLDPAIVTWLIAREGQSASRVEKMLNRESGLLGVSGVSGDMREIRAAAENGDAHAALALAMFAHRVRKYVGAYLVAFGRPDAIVFGGGIGEHSDWMRERICAGLEWLGIELDCARNRAANGREAEISRSGSRIKLFLIPLDEELYMARAAARLLHAQ
jgi:acetate kinase